MKFHSHRHQLEIHQHERGTPEMFSNCIEETLSRLSDALKFVAGEALNKCIINLAWHLFVIVKGKMYANLENFIYLTT